ncbi:MAG TPA: PqqD family protein [Polyangia bacterium]|jgi:hypothetical protein|nr:PqqD family protein [Polyangia bacterium]
MAIGADRSWTVNPLVSAAPMDAGVVLIDAATGECFELNRVGTEIWTALQGGTPPTQIAADLADRYGVPLAQVAADVDRLFEQMIARGILRVAVDR